jgi:hypothetical protein
MPPTLDCPILVINAHNGYVRTNQSWVLGRLVRDFEPSGDGDIDEKEKDAIQRLKAEGLSEEEARIGLRLSVYRASSTKEAGKPDRDVYWWVGLLISLAQLGMAAIPCGKYREWITLYVTGAGTILAYAFGALPQWAEEKWACRRNSKKTVVLTEGNGSKDCIIIQGDNVGLDLEDLASSRRVAKKTTRLFSLLLAASWLVLLICVAGFNMHTWYLVGLGTLGMLYNDVVAGVPRHPGAFGIHLIYQEVIVDRKVMDALAIAEERYPHLGLSLLSTFFPGKLQAREEEWWAYYNTLFDCQTVGFFIRAAANALISYMILGILIDSPASVIRAHSSFYYSQSCYPSPSVPPLRADDHYASWYCNEYIGTAIEGFPGG